MYHISLLYLTEGKKCFDFVITMESCHCKSQLNPSYILFNYISSEINKYFEIFYCKMFKYTNAVSVQFKSNLNSLSIYKKTKYYFVNSYSVNICYSVSNAEQD